MTNEWKILTLSDDEQAFFMYDEDAETLHVHYSVDGEPTEKYELRLGE